ncbi:S1 family peptidase [Amycolatopsis jejuensis]|uniref:S1 family peptidase n=1 Tax=Amycolatopsis jejuensis TaxID=330084 RepID=UPI0005240971|nr:serine protease [Amycolatopsis jejuensis]
MKTLHASACLAATALIMGATPAAAISGGEEATASYPFMASLQDLTGKHLCGGTLIAPRWIVTARHCVVSATGKQTDGKQLQVRLGSRDHRTGGRGSRVEVLPGDSASDIALLKLATPAYRTPAALPRTELKPGTAVRTIGWGDHDLPDHPGDPWPAPPNMLRQLDTHTTGADHCTEMNGKPMAANELCMAALPPANGSKWPQTSRAGDSGGPLLTKTYGRWTVHGAVSHGSTEQNGIFASVHAARKWIIATITR